MILLLGVGKKDKTTPTALRVSIRKSLVSSYLSKAKEVELVSYDPHDELVEAMIESILIGGYAWKKYVSKDKNAKTVDFKDKKFFIVAPDKKVYHDKIHVCEGVNFSRDLVNDNADLVYGDYLENTLKILVRNHKNISLEVLNKQELAKKGLNLILAVNKGSSKPAKLMIAKYHGAAKSDNFIALVGKGITFDTGGLNIKPTGHIETMRTDMSGAAAVLGVLKNVITLGLKKNLLFVLAVAENAVDAHSYKPGDIVRSYSGKTVEIGNTDAEGRLILADALSYVVQNYRPKKIIDIATLTGACVVALGYDYSGLMTNHEDLAHQLMSCAKKTDDRLWRLPLYPELKEYIKSQIADLKNVGLPKGAAGTLTAAEFLHQFVEDVPWAHVDIAGTAFVDGPSRFYFAHGSTGAGVRLLTDYLLNF